VNEQGATSGAVSDTDIMSPIRLLCAW